MSQFHYLCAPFSFYIKHLIYFHLLLNGAGFVLLWALCSVIDSDGLVQMETLYSEE